MKKIAYFDCFSGISGDMILGALLDAGLDFDALKAGIAKLNLPGCTLEHRKVSKRNIAATKFDVLDAGGQKYRHLADLNKVVAAAAISDDVKRTAKKIFLRIAEAEARIHDQPLEKVHFHEIGAVDTIVDVVGALVALEILDVEQVFSSPLNVGSGFVEFSHGKFPVPAPATAEILKGVPVYSTDATGELVTPTGAAIISEVAGSFGDMPMLTTQAVGYGAGERDREQPNVLRVFIGHLAADDDPARDTITVIETNIDDMNPQFYESVFEKLFANGALDVFMTNIMMKKSRPAIQLTVLCTPEKEPQLTQLIFEETTTIGLRIRQEARRKLQREVREIETEFGKIKFKVSLLDGKILNHSPEYEDCKKIAQEHGLSVKEVSERLARCEAFTQVERS